MDSLAKLFGSPARLKILRLFLFNDDTSFKAADVPFRTRTAKEAARKELALLVAAGVVKKRSGKEGVTYCANKRYEHYEPLHAFLRATTSMSDSDMVGKLKKAGSLRLVVVTGMFTGALEPKVDLLVVGDKLEDKPLETAIHAIEAELGRELRFAAFSTTDFRYRVGVYDRLIRDVFDYGHRTVLDRIGMQR